MSVEHALIMSYPFGRFPSIQHNQLRDITAVFCLRFVIILALNQLYNLYLENSSIIARSASVDDGARLDVSAEFLGSGYQNEPI